MKLIIDTNVYISAFAFGGVPKDLIKYLAKNTQIQVFSCTKLWLELKVRFLDGRMAKILGNSFDYLEAESYLKGIAKSSIFTEIVKINLTQISRDNDEDILLDLATKTNADFIITGDKDLLILKNYNGTQIISPKEFQNLTKL
jgi:putative PIN family toxin of toxin-antitoxin system